MRRILLAAAVGVLGALAIAPSAQALTKSPVWQCRGSAAYASVTGNNRVEPIVANGNINTANGGNPDRAQCVNAETGAGNTATQLGISTDFVAAVTGKASTAIAPELGRAIDQKAAAEGRVEDLSLPLGTSRVILGVGAANSTVASSCKAGTTVPQFTGDSRVADITLGGTPIALDGLVKALSDALAPLGFLVEIKPDERIVTPTSLTIRALHIKILRGAVPVVDLIVGEAKAAANGPVCDPALQGDTPTIIGTDVCPKGSVLDTGRLLCVIPASAGSSFGEIIIGRPFQGPSGGTVIPLDLARKRFGSKRPCLTGNQRPRFVIVGTNRANRITGTNNADRILALGGNDAVSGGRGNDCVEGGTGGDNLSGSLGNDRLYGEIGNDHLNGGPGSDRLSAGAGKDTINAAYGADRTYGGSGNDAINIATQGPRATANCGPGRNDKVRFNNKESRGVRGCEVRYTIRDR